MAYVFSPYSLVSTVTVSSDEPIIFSPNKQLPDVPFYPAYDFSNDRGMIGYYENLNENKKVRAKFIMYYYYKCLDKWLYEELKHVTGYMQIKNGKVDLLDKRSDYDEDKALATKDSDIEKMVAFVEEKVLSKKEIALLLNKFVSESNINYWDIRKHERHFRKMVGQYLERKMRKEIVKKEL